MVFLSDGEPVAYGLYRETPEEVYLRQFFARRGKRTTGFGRRAITILRQNIWPPQKRLTVEVLCQNTVGIQFWRAMGYKDYCLTLAIMPERQSVEQQGGGDALPARASP